MNLFKYITLLFFKYQNDTDNHFLDEFCDLKKKKNKKLSVLLSMAAYLRSSLIFSKSQNMKPYSTFHHVLNRITIVIQYSVG